VTLSTVDTGTSRKPVLSFDQRLRQEQAQLKRGSLEIVQVNLGKRCNQACAHCHVEASPTRAEIMSEATARQVVEFVRAASADTVDLTGGAPELNPSFRWLVSSLRQAGRRVIVRTNLTVLLEPGMEDLPEFFAGQGVELVASPPCYTRDNVDTQRGSGVYGKCMQALGLLNGLGYGMEGTRLSLNLVYNPLGAYLPGEQAGLEADYHRELAERASVSFNHLYTITNLPIGRFARKLEQSGELAGYNHLLSQSFNKATLAGLMCTRQVSISWEGYFYDCDFNQMLELHLGNGRAYRLGQEPTEALAKDLVGKAICTGEHCYGCTAGAGSSCTGALVI
jgi:radical SAM/Cys-rich protein